MLVDEMSAYVYHVLQLHEYVTHDELHVPTLTTENRIYTFSGNIFWWRFVPNKLSYKIFYLVAWLSWPGHLKASPKKPWNRIQNWKHDFGSP